MGKYSFIMLPGMLRRVKRKWIWPVGRWIDLITTGLGAPLEDLKEQPREIFLKKIYMAVKKQHQLDSIQSIHPSVMFYRVFTIWNNNIPPRYLYDPTLIKKSLIIWLYFQVLNCGEWWALLEHWDFIFSLNLLLTDIFFHCFHFNFNFNVLYHPGLSDL